MLDASKEHDLTNTEHTPLHATVHRRPSLPGIKETGMDKSSLAEIYSSVEAMCHLGGLQGEEEMLKRGARLFHFPAESLQAEDLTDKEREAVHNESARRWSQPFMLYFLVAIGAFAAVAQGMDETVVNGAQLYFHRDFGIENKVYIQGLLNSCPYLSAAVIGCWLAIPLNNWFGRRGSIFISMVITIAASVYEGFSPDWHHLLGARLVLGILLFVCFRFVGLFQKVTLFFLRCRNWCSFGHSARLHS